ncbi:MAG: FkbM family methyltransferase [Deltaproteobacteria bacterium]|nr:FkbM family methyltransferase [Deltaproteobacteria bacterium]
MAGFDIHRLSERRDPIFQLLSGFRNFNIELIIDVGANVGQFALDLRSVGYTGKIVSFEPLTAAYTKLCHIAARDKNWVVHERCAVGHFDGEIQINIAGNSFSSSILPMAESHRSAAKGSSYVGSEATPIVKLDTVGMEYLSMAKGQSFLKIDTQGFEWQVLDGASVILKQVQGIMCELSLVPLYEGQHLWMDVIDRLRTEGFTLWAIQPGFIDPRDGRALQFDGIFFRAKSGNWYID